jgi:D-glycero-D-manno-heptose 1,7-bisphosphate phosphatase
MSGAGRRAALFLDRDGVMIEDRGYVHRMEDVAYVPGIVDLVRAARDAGLAVVVVTNQSGIARGLFDAATYERFTAALTRDLARRGALVDAVYHCPHHPTEGAPPLRRACACRKPAPGLILRAARDLDLCLARSLLVGDSARDVEAARRAGIGRAILLGEVAPPGCPPATACPTLAAVRSALALTGTA